MLTLRLWTLTSRATLLARRTTRSTATSGRCRRSAGTTSTAPSTPAGRATVAVLDTGVDASHPDLAGRRRAGKNIITGSSDGTADPTATAPRWPGIVAAATDNGEGIAGVGYAGVKVMPVKVLGADGTGLDSRRDQRRRLGDASTART